MRGSSTKTYQPVIDRLVALGLTTYEARVFSALTELGEAGVAEIHSAAAVPRSAVYGTLEKLESRGIIESSAGRPRRFRALPPTTAISKIESELVGAVKDAKEGLEKLASAPHKESSEVRIWIIRGTGRIMGKLEDLAASAKSELFIAGASSHMLEFADLWKTAKSRRVKVIFATLDPERVRELSKYGEAARPRYRMKLPNLDHPKILFARADRRVVLFVSEYGEGPQGADLTAFWTDDVSFVGFLNYLIDSLTKPPSKKTKTARG